jgi:hypothetical protein
LERTPTAGSKSSQSTRTGTASASKSQWEAPFAAPAEDSRSRAGCFERSAEPLMAIDHLAHLTGQGPSGVPQEKWNAALSFLNAAPGEASG